SSARAYYLHVRIPPRSPRFPYTTLFRSCARRPLQRGGIMRRLWLVLVLLSTACADEIPEDVSAGMEAARAARQMDGSGAPDLARSEEHTSELQSRENLVCRLLLEKKNLT